MSVGLWVAVAALGGFGVVMRFAVDWMVSLRFGFGFPFGILAVNLSGAFLLGLLAGASVTGNAYLFAGSAVLGSYTTFSTWMFDTRQLSERGAPRAAASNVVISTGLGLAAAACGHAIASGL
jgi:fluoride exporter